MTIGEVADKMGLQPKTVARVASRPSWFGIMDYLMPFTEACGIDLLNMGPVKKRMRRHKQEHGSAFYYLTKSQERQLAAGVKARKDA